MLGSYSELFLEDPCELDAFNAQKLHAPLLWGKSVSSGDQAKFFSAVVQGLCGSAMQPTDNSLVVKVKAPLTDCHS